MLAIKYLPDCKSVYGWYGTSSSFIGFEKAAGDDKNKVGFWRYTHNNSEPSRIYADEMFTLSKLDDLGLW